MGNTNGVRSTPQHGTWTILAFLTSALIATACDSSEPAANSAGGASLSNPTPITASATVDSFRRPNPAGSGATDAAPSTAGDAADLDADGDWPELRTCADLIDGWVDPPVAPEMLYGEEAVETYTWFGLMSVDIDPWLLYDQVTEADNARNARVAAHLATMIDANGLFCGLVEADMDRLSRLGEPLPTTPPPGGVEEYVVWAKGACDSAERAIAECISGMAALEARYTGEGAAFEETEADRWGLYGTLHRALMIAEEIERRSEVPSEAQALHALVVEMAGEIDTAINTLGVVGPVDDPETDEKVGMGQNRVAELCAEINRQADALRNEHSAR